METTKTLSKFILPATVVTSAIFVSTISGTGSMPTPESLTSYSEWHVVENFPVEQKAIQSPAEQMVSILDVLQLSMSDLALLLGVSRPTAYDWLKGVREPSANAQKQISVIAELAAAIVALGIMRMDILLHRPIFARRSFFDRLKAKEEISQDDLIELKNISDREALNRQKVKQSSKAMFSLSEAASYVATPIYRE